MNQYSTDQEAFWAGKFGRDYSERNTGRQRIESNASMFREILSHTDNVKSIIEYGANIGLNLQAIQTLSADYQLSAVEINEQAYQQLTEIKGVQAYHQSLLDFRTTQKWDLCFTKGVLIHLNPELLTQAYELLYNSSDRYICVAEYYNPTPVSVSYRGNNEVLFKRDFAGELLDRFNTLKLVNYGFVYHLDPEFPQDDISWFLLEKR